MPRRKTSSIFSRHLISHCKGGWSTKYEPQCPRGDFRTEQSSVGGTPVYYLECVAGRRKLMRAPSGNLLGLRCRQLDHAWVILRAG